MQFSLFAIADSVNPVVVAVEIALLPAIVAVVTTLYVVKVVFLRESIRADVVLFHSVTILSVPPRR